MSGPKAVGISPLVAPIVPIALVVGAAVYGAAALAALTADYISYRRNLSRYRMLAEEWEGLRRRLEELGVSRSNDVDPADAVRGRAEAFAGGMQVSAAASFLISKIGAAEGAIQNGKRLLEERIMEMQRRFRALSEQARLLAEKRRQLTSFVRSVVPSEWPVSERERLLSFFQEKLRQVETAPPFSLELNVSGIRQLEEAWCADHALLREKMAANGMGTKFKLKIAAGEHPVKVVVDKEKGAAQRRRAGIEEKRQGQRTL